MAFYYRCGNGLAKAYMLLTELETLSAGADRSDDIIDRIKLLIKQMVSQSKKRKVTPTKAPCKKLKVYVSTRRLPPLKGAHLYPVSEVPGAL